jgi:hypothetical protein
MKALKKVPGDKKGLSKLPTAVRNKMGYMKKGGKVKGNAPKKGGMLDEATVTAKAPTRTEKVAAKEFSKGLSAMKLGFPNSTVNQYYQLESVGNKARRKAIDYQGDIEGAFDAVDKLKKDTRKRAKEGKSFRYKKGGKVFKPHMMYKDGKSVMAKTMKDHLRLKKQGYTHKKG